jgi:LysM repeat protein
MSRSSTVILLILSVAVLASCRARRPAVSPSARVEADAQSYIAKYKDLAISEMKRTGVPASITLAQGMIESDYGRSSLAIRGNNHFGIKCHNGWTGPVIYHHDDKRNDCFRKYNRVEDSYYDHSDFLRTGSRYSFLFKLAPTDYKAWAKGLKQAGYATNPDYANMLIRKIEENSLYYFDNPILAEKTAVPMTAVKIDPAPLPGTGNTESEPVIRENVQIPPVIDDNFVVSARVSRVMENNRIQYIIVKDGETLEMIENEFQLLKWELQRYNELPDGFTPVAGQILYLQPKRDRAEPGKETHTAAQGDTMYAISQKYGVKVKKLYEYNGMTEGAEPVPGQQVRLRSIKPEN